MNDSDKRGLEGRLEFLRQAEQLKDTLRSGYTSSGRTESVADHSWRLCLFVITFADLLGDVDILKLLKICILHDLGEAIDGDIPAPDQVGAESKSEKEREDFLALCKSLPDGVRDEFLAIWDDYEYVNSKEAESAKALDKLETILQHNQGNNPDDFDYGFNLDYGRKYTDAIKLAAELRETIDKDTKTRQRDSLQG